jgi:hypothetical protein
MAKTLLAISPLLVTIVDAVGPPHPKRSQLPNTTRETVAATIVALRDRVVIDPPE